MLREKQFSNTNVKGANVESSLDRALFNVYRKQWKELYPSRQKRDLARLLIDVLLYKKR